MDKDLINYDDYYNVYNPANRAYDLVHKQTGSVIKSNTTSALSVARSRGFEPEIADRIIEEVINGKTLAQISNMIGMPSMATIGFWMKNHKLFKDSISFARELSAESIYTEIMDIARESRTALKDDVPGMKLAIDTLKWAAEKAHPERFAKVKEEGNNSTAITINLKTGVLDAESPKDIVVDQFGNFKGFNDEDNGSSSEWSDITHSGDIELSRERWQVREESGESEDGSTGGETEESSQD